PVRALICIGLDSGDTLLRERPRRSGEYVLCEQNVVCDHRHHDVQLQLTVLGCRCNTGVETNDLEADLVHHLGDGRIDLAGHDRRSRLYRRQRDFVETRAWTAHHDTEIARDLAEIECQHLHRRAEGSGVTHALHELDSIRTCAEVSVHNGIEVLHHQRGILWLDVDAGADGAAADSQITQIVGGLVHALEIPRERSGECSELLSQPDWHRVLKVRASGLHYTVEVPSLLRERVDQRLNRVVQLWKLRDARDSDRSWNHVIRGLRHVDVVVRMNR